MYATDDQKEKVRGEAEANAIPCISKSNGNLLELLVTIKKCGIIVEIGAGNGYSTLFLANGAASANGHVISFEKDSARFALAENNLRSQIASGLVQLHGEDALIKSGSLNIENIDFLFIDGMKRQYAETLDLFFGRLSKGALIFADDVFFQGVTNPAETLGRHKNIVRGLREYLTLIENMEKKGLVSNYLFDHENGYSITIKN